MCAERLFGVKSQRIISGLSGSCSSQKPSLQYPSWLRCVRAPQGKVLRQINCEWEAEQDDWPEGRQRPRKLFSYKAFKLHKGTILSLSLLMHLFTHTFLFSKLFYSILYLLPSHLNSFLTRQAGLRTLALPAGSCGPVIRTPSLASIYLLLLLAESCPLLLCVSEIRFMKLGMRTDHRRLSAQ